MRESDRQIRLAIIKEKLASSTISSVERKRLEDLRVSILSGGLASWKSQLIRRVDTAIRSGHASPSLLVDVYEFISGECYPLKRKRGVSGKKVGLLLVGVSVAVIVVILLL